MATLALVLTAVLLGSMLLFLVVIAPTVFQVLEPEPAGVFLRATFPRLYLWCTVLAAGAAGVLGVVSLPAAGAMAAVAAGSAYSNWGLTPQINRARDAWKEGRGEKAAFDRLHKRSTRIYGVQLLVVLGVLLSLAL